jgi:hypothetical protein
MDFFSDFCEFFLGSFEDILMFFEILSKIGNEQSPNGHLVEIQQASSGI